jgi:transposase
MKRFIQGEHRGQGTLLPESLDDYVSDTNPVRVVDVFVDELDLVKLGFKVPFQPILAGRLTTP